jgi:hypothetical protein
VVVVLDGSNSETYRVANGFFGLDSVFPVDARFEPLEIGDATDPVAAGVAASYAGTQPGSTGGTVVVRNQNTLAAVVRHLVR